MLISGIWNALAIFIPIHFDWSPETIALVVTIGNLVIQWIALETNQNHERERSRRASPSERRRN